MATPTASTPAAPRPGPGAITLFAGAFAWFAQLNIGYALATGPCFPGDVRLTVPGPNWTWTQSAMPAVSALCCLIALWAFLRSLRSLRRETTSLHAMTAAANRYRFAALWGASFGGGFFVATLLTGVGLILLPRCGG